MTLEEIQARIKQLDDGPPPDDEYANAERHEWYTDLQTDLWLDFIGFVGKRNDELGEMARAIEKHARVL